MQGLKPMSSPWPLMGTSTTLMPFHKTDFKFLGDYMRGNIEGDILKPPIAPGTWTDPQGLRWTQPRSWTLCMRHSDGAGEGRMHDVPPAGWEWGCLAGARLPLRGHE